MKLLPFEKFEFVSKKNIDDLCFDIDKNYEPWKFAFWGRRTKPLFGSRKGNEFKLYRAIQYSNSFLPIAIGKLEKTASGTKTKIILRMNIFTTVFMFVWLSFTLLAAIVVQFKDEAHFSLLPFAMFGFGYLLMQGSFWFEVPKLKKIFNEIFDS